MALCFPPRKPTPHTFRQPKHTGQREVLSVLPAMRGMLPAMISIAQPVVSLPGAQNCIKALAAACRCLPAESSSSYATSTATSKPGDAQYVGGPSDGRYKRFLDDLNRKPSRGYDYEWVIVSGGQRMLARAPAGTKRWRIWASYEDLELQELQRKRRAQQGRMGTWVVNVGGLKR